jgi:hypothetical protein
LNDLVDPFFIVLEKLGESILEDKAYSLHILEKLLSLLARNKLQTFVSVDLVNEPLGLWAERVHVVLGCQCFLAFVDGLYQLTVDVQDL